MLCFLFVLVYDKKWIMKMVYSLVLTFISTRKLKSTFFKLTIEAFIRKTLFVYFFTFDDMGSNKGN